MTLHRRHARRVAGLPDVLQFMRLLWAVVHGLDSTSKRMTRAFGVTGPQRLVLRVVGLFPGLSAGELARILHMHPSTLTGILHRLVEQRLVARVDDPVDRRRALRRLSARGARANSVTLGTVESAIAEVLADGSDLVPQATRRVLELLAHHLTPSPARRVRRVVTRKTHTEGESAHG
jgi:DNA-binding MarR family transcriptional regulator